MLFAVQDIEANAVSYHAFSVVHTFKYLAAMSTFWMLTLALGEEFLWLVPKLV
jgi:hypothetical protein